MTVISSNQASDRVEKPIVIALLMISFVMPFFFFLGGLKLSGYRVVLLVFMFPAVFRWLNGGAGKVRGVDILIIFFSFWTALTIAANHGLGERWQFIGMLMIETLVPYFIARAYIRDLAAFRYFVWWFFVVILALLPFALFEMLTEKAPLLNLFGKVMSVYQKFPFEPRLGLERAQVTMPHPILFGVFCAPAFALSWYVLGWNKKLFARAGLVSVAGSAVFASLSSGAFMNVIIQMMLMAWNKLFQFLKNKWKVLLTCFGLLYFVLEIGSNRNVFQIFATHMTLTPGTAWSRILTFTYASDDILRNPILGIGMHDWTRPHWMQLLSSVDNFWLVITLRHGFPGLFLLAVPVIALFFQLGSRKLTGAMADARLGYLISLSGLTVSAVTVHLWDATFCLFMFLLGAGVWFLDADDEQEQGVGLLRSPAKDRKIQYTRFPKAPPDKAPTARTVRPLNR